MARDVLGRGAAAAADDVQQAGRGELAEHVRLSSRAARRIRRTRSAGPHSGSSDTRVVATAARSARYGRICAAPSAQLMPTLKGRACADRDPERLDRLSRQRAAAVVGDRHRDHDRQSRAAALEHLLARDDGGFRVQRVEDGFDQQRVAPAVDQAAHLVLVGVAQLVEREGAVGRVVHVRRDRERPVRRADRARDETRLVGRSSPSMRQPPRARGGPPRRSARTRAPRARSPPARSRCR